MNALYSKYEEPIDGFFNANKCADSWDTLVKIFFGMNNDADGIIASMEPLAITFRVADRPNYLWIDADSIQSEFASFVISQASLRDEGFKDGFGFIEDDNGCRVSFSTIRWLVFRKGDLGLIEKFDFIDMIYQRYIRCRLQTFSNSHSHWTIFKRVGKFTKEMQPHVNFNKSAKKLKMTTQPDVYCICTGNSKSLNKLIDKYDNEDENEKTFQSEPMVQIYESTLSNAK